MEHSMTFASLEEIRPKRLLRFIIPAYLTSLLTTLYTIVDGLFVSSYVGTHALAAINLVYPIVNVLEGLSLGLAAGGSALAAQSIGAGRKQEASRIFTACTGSALGAGALIAGLILYHRTWVLHMLGATALTWEACEIYAFWWLAGTPAVMLKSLLVHFIRTDGSPGYSFMTALSGGLANLVLDALFIARWRMGILGAALATILGLMLSSVLGLYYIFRRSQWLQFSWGSCRWTDGWRCLVNGSSEWMDQLAVAITTVVFNRMAMTYAGEDGVAAVSILMYLQFLVLGIYYGCSKGLSTPLGYAYGCRAFDVCRRLERYAYSFFAGAPLLLYGLTYVLAPIGVGLFVQAGTPVYELAVSGMRWYGLSFLFSGLNLFCEIRLTAYGKGHLSGVITSLRSLILLLLFLEILPIFAGIQGVWLAVPCAEAVTLLAAAAWMRSKRLQPESLGA